jgi:Beta-propeller repeat
MGNRGTVGAIFARGRAPVILVLLLVGGAFLLRRDVTATPAHNSSDGSALSNPQQIQVAFGRLPLSFEPNQGQSDSRVKFLAHGNGYGLYLTSSEAVLALPPRSQVRSQVSSKDSSKDQSRPFIEMQFGGANRSAPLAGTSLLPGKSSYFIGNDRSRWHRNIPQFSRVQYRDLYSGIDLDFYGRQGRLEYDFEVAPGADPAQIALDFKGTKNLQVAANGDLVLTLDGGDLRFEAPHIYQKTENGEQPVAGSFALRSDNRVTFQIGAYDRSRALVIDPVLTFSTYLGGSGDESCRVITGAPVGSFVPHCPAIAVDSATRVYVAGATSSTAGFPVPAGGAATDGPLGGGADVFLVRFNSTGTALDYTTFVGGSGTDYPTGVGVDSGFNVYVTGTTNSGNYPVTTSAYQSGPLGPANTNHVFFSKFDSSGSVDLYSTYLSGSTGVDSASDLAVDGLGRAYIIGTTSSSDFPTTAGALQPTAAATNQFFFSKIDPKASGTGSLLYSTFLGGSAPGNGIVTGGSIAVDATYNVYLAGGTNFTNMPIVNAYQGTEQGGYDVWAAKLQAPANNTEQYTPLYETYFGGAGDDIAYGVATDGTDTFITGSTTSTNITAPTTIVPFQATNGGGTDAFIAKLGTIATVGTTQGAVPLLYFTYLGGPATDTGLAIATDTTSGNARVTGFTDGGFPTTGPAFGSGGSRDAFVARILTNTVSTTTNTSTANILGGSGTDIGTSIAIDANLNDYVVGETSSVNFPLQPVATPFQANRSGPTDTFVAKLGPDTSGLSFTCSVTGCPSPVPSNPVANPSPVGVGNQVIFTYSIYNTGDPVAGVLFTDTLSSNSTFVSASASPGTCPTTALNGVVVCNLGIIPTSITTTSGTTTTTAPAATVTVTVASTVPTSTGCSGMTTSSINNFGALTAGPLFSTATAQNFANVNDFCVTVSPSTATVTAGAPATYVVQVTPTGAGIPESVSLSCGSGLPSGAACAFLNNPIPNLNNGPQSRSLEISTQFRVTTPASIFRRGPIYAFWFPVSGLAMLGAGVSRKRRPLLGLFFAAVLGTVALQAGCGSSSSSGSTTTGTPAGTYTITINATSVAVRSTTVQLTVN